MRALTLPQPVATLVALGIITTEPCPWSTTYRGPLAIHAAAVYPQWAKDRAQQGPFRSLLRNAGFQHWIDLPTSAVIAVCQLVDCRLIETAPDEQTIAWNPSTLGHYTWYFTHPRLLPKPICVPNGWGLWEWDVPPDLADVLGTGEGEDQRQPHGRVARITF